MEPSRFAFEMIKSWEDLRLRAYKAIPQEKFYTIGFGHYSADIKKRDVITIEEANRLLVADVNAYASKLDKFCPNLEQHQYDALCSLIFNIGWYNFRYNMVGIYAHNLHVTTTPIDVARRMVLYVRSGSRVLLGLQRRRVEEANYFLQQQKFQLINNTITEI